MQPTITSHGSGGLARGTALAAIRCAANWTSLLAHEPELVVLGAKVITVDDKQPAMTSQPARRPQRRNGFTAVRGTADDTPKASADERAENS